MSQHISSQTELNLVAEVAKRLANGGLKPAAVQAMLESKPDDQSSLDDKIVATWEGVSFTQRQLDKDRLICNYQVLRRHSYGGGWVPLRQNKKDKWWPYVAPSAYVGPFAVVRDDGRVLRNAQLSGSAQVSESAQVLGKAWLHNVQLHGTAWLAGREKLSSPSSYASRAEVEKVLVW